LFAEYARNGWPVEAWTAGTPGAWKTALQLPSLTAIAAAFASVGYVVYVRCSDALVLSRLSESARVEGGFSASLRAVLCELCRSFDAHGARLLAHDHRSNRAFLWVLDSSVTERSLQCLEITGTVHAEANAAFAASHAAHVWREPFLVGEWTGQVILIEPGAVRTRRLSTLFTRAVRQVTPGLYDMFRTARVRSRAVARERARVARQIHDGTIQALLGTEMQLEALWNQCRQSGLDSVTGELTRIRLLMHREVLNLRDLMLQLKPLDVRVEELPELLEDMVGRFAYDSGIEASFSGRISGVDLSRRACAEIVRIVQEGLSNIRKHSGAKRVLVQLESAAGGIRLLIEDTGVGFNFDGWVQLVASDDVRPSDLAAATPAAHPHPWELAALRESVRAIDGELVLHSRRGAGARLEIIIPGKPAAVQAARRAS
jgi:signal transduction histidine kinase